MNPDTIQQIIEMATYGESVMLLCPRGTELDKVRRMVREKLEDMATTADSFTLNKRSFNHQSGGRIFFELASHWNDSSTLKGYNLDHCFVINPHIWVELESKQTNINYLFT